MKNAKYLLILSLFLFLVNFDNVKALDCDSGTCYCNADGECSIMRNPRGDKTIASSKSACGCIELSNEISFCEETRVLKAFQIIGYILFVLKILVPLLLIILGSVDFAKSVISSDEKSNKEALNSLIKRIIAGIIIFLIPSILNYILLLIDGAEENASRYSKCTTCVLKPFECSE